MRRVAWVVALVALWMPGVGAARAGNEMEKLPDVSIVVEVLDADAAKCNVTTSGLDAAVRVTLDKSRLPVHKKSSDMSYLYVNANSLRLADGLCVASVHLSLNRGVFVKSTGKFSVGKIWETNSLLTGPSHDFGQRVNAEIRAFAEEFLGAWIQQNPKPAAAP